MNRCQASSGALSSLAALYLGAALFAGTALLPASASAQMVDPSQTQNEAAAGGRNFPNGTLRGSFQVINAPEILLDGQGERMSPGARIYGANRMLVMASSITGQQFLVNYKRDPAGAVSQVWILTPEEAGAKRATADHPFLNFWPFTSASSAPRDDGKTPFDQLPKYGQ